MDTILDLTPPRAVLLDFNGTVSLDEPLLERLFRAVFAGIGIVVDAAFYERELVGLSDPAIVAEVLREHGRPRDADLEARLLRLKVDAYLAAIDREPMIDAASAAFIEGAAARVPVAIGSGAVLEELRHALAARDLLGLFSAIVSSDDVFRGKPAPETYLACLERLNAGGADLRAGDCLVFEDSRFGIAAAHAAGMPCVGVRGTGAASALAAADAIVERLQPGLLEPLFERVAA